VYLARLVLTDAMPQLVALATAPDTDAEVRSEVYWVILNATSCGSDSQVSHMITYDHSFTDVTISNAVTATTAGATAAAAVVALLCTAAFDSII
jgi:hypothetical protein